VARAASLLLLLAPLLAAGLATGAHPEGLEHVRLVEGRLDPGARASFDAEFNGRELSAGWIWILNARVQSDGAPLLAALAHGGTEVARWSIPPGDTFVASVRLPVTARYNLTLANEGDGPLSFAFYFDQSCNCLGKIVPPELLRGVVVFNADLEEGDELEVTVPDPPAVDLHVRAMRLSPGTAGRYPQDFVILWDSPAGPERADHVWQFRAPATDRYYFFATAAARAAEHADPTDSAVVPTFRFVSAGTSGTGDPGCQPPGSCPSTPWLEAAATGAILALAAATMRKRR